MTRDLTIRLLGRPQVSKDSQIGYQTVRRTYVVEGPRASLEGIEDSSNPLFLEVGTPDEEFTNHYLVNQQLSPAQGSMDKATLVRDFVEIRNTWATESISESGDLKRLTRRYVVLRAQNPDTHSLGYDIESWENHPRNPANNQKDPFDYLPTVVYQTQPNNEEVHLPGMPWGASGKDVNLAGDEKLYAGLRRLSTDMGVGSWLPMAAQVSMAAPGVDVWTVAWVTHGKPYWTTGTTKGGAMVGPAAVLDIDENGIRINQVGVTGSSVTQAYTFIFYAVAENLPTELIEVFGGSSGIQPSVSLDFNMVSYEGNRRVATEKRVLPNTVFQHRTGALTFPNSKGTPVKVATGDGVAMQIRFLGDFYNGDAPSLLPIYQGEKLKSAGGNISYTHLYDTTKSVASMVGTKIRPIASHRDRKIWRVEVTYLN